MTWKTISYSKLHLLACPYAAFLKYEAAIKGPTTPWIARGNAIHTALEKAHKVTPFNLPHAVQVYKDEFSRIIEEEDVAIGWPQLKKMESEGIQMLEKYSDKVASGIVSQTPLALEAEFKLPFLETSVVGKIDKVERDEFGYIVTDYKTGKAKPDKWFLRHNLQLTAYAWACQELYGELPYKLIWHHLATDELLETERTELDIKDLKVTIGNALSMHDSGIKHRIFHEQVCGQCDYQGATCDDRDLEEEVDAVVAAGGRMPQRIVIKPPKWSMA